MQRFFTIERGAHKVRWAMVLIAAFTVVSLGLATSWGIKAFASTDMSSTVAPAKPATIDATAQAKYEAKIAADKLAAEQAKQAEIAAKQQAEEQSAKQQNPTKKSSTPKQSTTPKSAPKQAAPQPAPNTDRLIIPKIGMNAQLVNLGLTSDGAVDVHPTLPGWFNQSSRAGTSSGVWKSTFIDGHSTGIFRNLGRLAVGDTVTVSLANGESYTYTVRKTEVREVGDPNLMRDSLGLYNGQQTLTLMTCDGSWNGLTYSQRLVVYATR
jgi:LPXTG-site transpeptidase (sortase) family protein